MPKTPTRFRKHSSLGGKMQTTAATTRRPAEVPRALTAGSPSTQSDIICANSMPMAMTPINAMRLKFKQRVSCLLAMKAASMRAGNRIDSQ